MYEASALLATCFTGGELRHFMVGSVVRYVILFFYPFDFTFVCPTEIMAFNSVVDDLRAKGAEVLGISTDSVHSHLAYRRLEPSQGGWAWQGLV